MVFICYSILCPEVWVTEERFTQMNERTKQWSIEYSSRPEVKARRKEQSATPETKARLLKWRKTDKARSYKAAYVRAKKATDPSYAIEQNVRKRVYYAMRGIDKSQRTAALIGCSWDFFRGWLESKFTDGMTWTNYGRGEGKWNIDHVIPIALFDLTKEDHQRLAFNYRNCRPAWSRENYLKSDIIDLQLVKQFDLESTLCQLN